jgi:hypothetical protein
MEKRIFDIKLVNGPCGGDGCNEDCSNGDGLNNRGESFFVVDAMLRRKTVIDLASFITRKTAIGVEFFDGNPIYQK